MALWRAPNDTKALAAAFFSLPGRAKTAIVFGGLLFRFGINFHLAHFTWGLVQSDAHARVETVGGVARHDVYSMTVLGFQQWWLSGLYVVALLLLGSHLRHGIPSLFQTLGIEHPRYDGLIRRGGTAVAVLIASGYIAIPVAVLAGLIELPEGAPTG